MRAGDLLRLQSDEAVAADMLLLASSSADGLAYVDTVELDGESSLKAS